MKNSYYVIRNFRNGRSAAGYDTGKPNRFATLAEAESNAAKFAGEVLPVCPSDYIVVGSGLVRSGKPIATFHCAGRVCGGAVVRRAYGA